MADGRAFQFWHERERSSHDRCSKSKPNYRSVTPINPVPSRVESSTSLQASRIVTGIKEKWESRPDEIQLEENVVAKISHGQFPPKSKTPRRHAGRSSSFSPPIRTKLSAVANQNHGNVEGCTRLQTSGIVTGMKEKWEHGPDKMQVEEKMVAKSSQSLPKGRTPHKRAGRSSSFSPPVRTKLYSVVSGNNSHRNLDFLSPPRGGVKGLTMKFEQSIPPSKVETHNVTGKYKVSEITRRASSSLSVNDTKPSAVRIKNSGFKCYIDGPVDGPIDDPPPSPSRKVSDLLKSIDIPEEMNFTVAPTFSVDTAEFWEMVDMLGKKSRDLTQERPNYLTAPILSQQLENSVSDRHSSISVKSSDLVTVSVLSSKNCPSITSQCPQRSSVSSILAKTAQRLKDPSKELTFKVCGRDEYLESHQRLCDYEYVQLCRKFSTEVRLIITNKPQTKRIGNSMTEAVCGKDTSTNHDIVSQRESNNLLESFYTTEMRFRNIASAKDVANVCTSVLALAQSVVSCIKLICERLAFIEPPKLTEAVYEFRRACRMATQSEVKTSFYSPEDSYSDFWVSVADQNVISEEHVEDMMKALDVVKSAVHDTLALYCNSFHPGYQPKWVAKSKSEESSHTVGKMLKIKICALHRVNEVELQKLESLQVEVSIYHGGKLISKKAHSPLAKVARNFFCSVVWDKWLNVGVPIKSLPRESRVLFVLHGVELSSAGTRQSKHVISWTSLNLFDSTGVLKSGDVMLGMWPEDDIDPLTSPSDPEDKTSSLLQISFEDNARLIRFPKHRYEISKKDCSTPSPGTFRTLTNIAQRDRFYCLTSDEEELIWLARFSCSSHLKNYPRGLPLVLLSTPHWHTDALADIWSIVTSWPLTDATFGLELLDPQFVDIHVRTKAVEWLSQLNDDDICDILPQLVQSMQYDCYHCSAMSKFLLTRAIVSPRILHFLYWNLRLLEASNLRMKARSNLMLKALEKLVGTDQSVEFSNQLELVDQLRTVANAVKSARDTHRQTTLIHELRRLSGKFVSEFRLPLDPALLVKDIDIESCSFFNSNTVPLKLSFLNADPFGEPIDVIYKIGDDLRQDILVLQMIKVMEKIWLRAGLDLKIVTYKIVATGIEEGMLEMVTNASTLRAIQTEHGLTGSFKDKPLSEWLMRHNPTDASYKAAVETFTLSCAGYCVATFILGICDRHNDNIMIKKSGHMFHIDFGKILGNAQMFGNIKRDRVPFVLTRDMAYVINGSDRPTEKFQRFTDLCCTAYNALRKHSSLILSLLSMMLPSGLSAVDSTDDILYVRDALFPGKSDLEATYTFTKYIDESLSSLATPLNFFIHNLAQHKFSSSTNSQAILSFCPQTYSIATDGKITSATIVDTHKRFCPETHFVYNILVCREGSKQTDIFRRYREFHEMHTKLIQSFPDALLPQFPGKVLIGHKSKQTVEKRKSELSIYLKELLALESQISESDVVYTFLHCLIRDEQELIKLSEENKELHAFTGKIKLEILYSVRHQSLKVMVRHVRGLVPREGYEMADPYVKLYLLPDHNKETKKKTKIAKRTLNPTYNETFSYTIPQSALSSRNLQLSIWDASNILSNQCLCMTTIELAKIRSELMNDASVLQWFELRSMQDS